MIHRMLLQLAIFATLALTWVQSLRISPPQPSTRSLKKTTELGAWSIPRPPNMDTNAFSGGAWYQECNPTARKTVYNDVFLDYGYADDESEDDVYWVLPGSSRLSVGAPSVTPSEQPRQGRRQGPFRRAAKWARRQILGGSGDQD